jgi:hypothetical protein
MAIFVQVKRIHRQHLRQCRGILFIHCCGKSVRESLQWRRCCGSTRATSTTTTATATTALTTTASTAAALAAASAGRRLCRKRNREGSEQHKAHQSDLFHRGSFCNLFEIS